MNPTTRILFTLPALLLVAGFFVFFQRGGGNDAAVDLSEVEVPRDGWPRVVQDPGGAEVTIAAPPERVLLGNSSAVDMLTALVGPERIAALPEQAFSFSILAEDAGAFADVATFHVFDAETVLSFEPDLVIVDPWATLETVARLRELGVTVVSLPQVIALDDVRAGIRLLGDVLGAEARAERLIDEVDERCAALAASAVNRDGLTACSYTNSGAGGWSAGAGTTNHELITLAGLVNTTAVAGRRDHVRTSFEELYAMDPDFLIVGDFRDNDEPGASARYLRNEPALAELRAVREDRILVVPARLFAASSQEVVHGAEVLAAAVDAWLAEHATAGGEDG